MTRAIALRWKYLAHSKCGLTIGSKWVVASLEIALSTLDYGNKSTNGLPIVPGLTIADTLVGNESFVVAWWHRQIRSSWFGCHHLRRCHYIAEGTNSTSTIPHHLQHSTRESNTYGKHSDRHWFMTSQRKPTTSLAQQCNQRWDLNIKPSTTSPLSKYSYHFVTEDLGIGRLPKSCLKHSYPLSLLRLTWAFYHRNDHSVPKTRCRKPPWKPPMVTASGLATLEQLMRRLPQNPCTSPSSCSWCGSTTNRWSRRRQRINPMDEGPWKPRNEIWNPHQISSTPWHWTIRSHTLLDSSNVRYCITRRNCTPPRHFLWHRQRNGPTRTLQISHRFFKNGSRKEENVCKSCSHARIADADRFESYIQKTTLAGRRSTTVIRAKLNPISYVFCSFNGFAKQTWTHILQLCFPMVPFWSNSNGSTFDFRLIHAYLWLQIPRDYWERSPLPHLPKSSTWPFTQQNAWWISAHVQGSGHSRSKGTIASVTGWPLLRPGDLFIPNVKTDDFTHTRHAIDFTAPYVVSLRA